MGNTSSLIYNWIGPNGFASNTQDINQLIFGTYLISITNNNGCIFNDSVLISQILYRYYLLHQFLAAIIIYGMELLILIMEHILGMV